MSQSTARAAQSTAEEEERRRAELIKEHKLIRPGGRKDGVAWKADFIWLSSQKERSKEYYCMKCNRWYKGATSANVKAHCERAHREQWEALLAKYGGKADEEEGGSAGAASASASGSSITRASGGGMTQMKLGNVYGEPLMRLHRSLTGFLIRDMRAFNLIEGEGFIRWASCLSVIAQPLYPSSASMALRWLLIAQVCP
jgi:hypothetical protein